MAAAKPLPWLLLLTLACMACGDDDAGEPKDAGQDEPSGGRGGRGGGGGRGGVDAGGSGTGGRMADCAEPVREDLSAWCARGKPCDVSSDELLRRFCEIVGPAPSFGTRAFVQPNSCGGRSVSYVLGGDVYDEVDHFNAEDELVGVVTHPAAFPCHSVRNVYGMECESQGANMQINCGLFDLDAGD